MPQEYCDELLHLVDNVEPVPWPSIRSILTEEFQRSPDQVFAWIDPRPVAAGSLSQVHRARTFEGDEVAVKVQRPDVTIRVVRDLKRMRRALRIVPAVGSLAAVDRKALAGEIERWLMEELDFARELGNTLALYETANFRNEFRVPRPVEALCGRRVLTQEFLRGVPCSELIRLVGQGREDQIETLGIDRIAFSRNLIRAMLYQVFSAPVFHADPHPGNLIVLSNDVVGFVDFGIADRLDERLRNNQLRYVSAVFSGDTEVILKAMSDMLVFESADGLDVFRADFLEGMRRWRRDRDLPGERQRSPLAIYLIQMMQSARRNRAHVPVEILSMYRALLAAESIAFILSNDEVGLRQEARTFFTQLQFEAMFEQFSPHRLQMLSASFVTLLRETPGQLSRLLSDLADDRFVLRTQTSEAPEERRASNARTRLLVAAILFVGGAIIFSGLPDQIVGPWTLRTLGAVMLCGWFAAIVYMWARLR
ncbi:AarF/ABC1/UbiB kinase family protein [Bradyrhizobium sp. SZCCHNRI1009]|uniref:ABC1 kinase family protein n=1 Tax=Bradyrhizobium sp. SZCCHNRI1009 TaxID=3057277 RepID=UPI002915CCE3|nr:AarF/ABC1/UbiB kinase family protein [Bradyrhizobium sp. SZCCHNRI1009]